MVTIFIISSRSNSSGSSRRSIKLIHFSSSVMSIKQICT